MLSNTWINNSRHQMLEDARKAKGRRNITANKVSHKKHNIIITFKKIKKVREKPSYFIRKK